MTNYNDGKWHGWNGGERPVHPKSVIEYVWASNSSEAGVKTRVAGYDDACIAPSWSGQLKAFRVVKEYREPKEYTIDPKNHIIWYSSDDDLVHVREVTK